VGHDWRTGAREGDYGDDSRWEAEGWRASFTEGLLRGNVMGGAENRVEKLTYKGVLGIDLTIFEILKFSFFWDVVSLGIYYRLALCT
jgi:hypothetical protein